LTKLGTESEDPLSWYENEEDSSEKCPCLLEAIDQITLSPRSVSEGGRIPISKVFSPPKKKDEGDEDEEGVIVMGRMIGSSSFRTNSILSLTPPPSNLPLL